MFKKNTNHLMLRLRKHADVPPFHHTPSFTVLLVQGISEHNGTLSTNFAIISELDMSNCKRKHNLKDVQYLFWWGEGARGGVLVEALCYKP
jgi:hypothetical protein